MTLDWPLMDNNIPEEDLTKVIEFLGSNPILTQSSNVRAFEKEWSEWLGVKYSVFVNSGASANLLTISLLKLLHGTGEIIVPTLTWSSDISSVLFCDFTPVFVDINPKTLGMAEDQIIKNINSNTKAVFLSHIQGFNALSDNLLQVLKEKNIPLIEDVCESHGATHKGQKLGSFGLISNFSYYYAHHMSTIEGGMICTNDEEHYRNLLMLRSHGMVRESKSKELQDKYLQENPGLHPEFIFAFPAFNVRSTEINAVIGRNQLKRLDQNNIKRTRNQEIFLNNLDSKKYRTDYFVEGSVNYAFNLVIVKKDPEFFKRVTQVLDQQKVEFRRGSAGGGNQLRQPYVKSRFPEINPNDFPEVEHIHQYGFYMGNFPELQEEKILSLCEILNKIE